MDWRIIAAWMTFYTVLGARLVVAGCRDARVPVEAWHDPDHPMFKRARRIYGRQEFAWTNYWAAYLSIGCTLFSIVAAAGVYLKVEPCGMFTSVLRLLCGLYLVMPCMLVFPILGYAGLAYQFVPGWYSGLCLCLGKPLPITDPPETDWVQGLTYS